jgi:hypothetical protein
MAAHLLWLLTAWPLGKFGGQCVALYIDKGGEGKWRQKEEEVPMEKAAMEEKEGK